jgi:hypothetical protein
MAEKDEESMELVEKKPEEQLELEVSTENSDGKPSGTSGTAEKAPISEEDALEALKLQLEEEKKARSEAEKRAHEASVTATRANSETQNANLALISNVIERFKGENEQLKAAYRDAMSANDYDRAAEIQLAMSQRAAQMQQLETGKAALEEEAKRPAVSADPVEAFASRLSPRSAEWVRSRPQFVTDARLHQKMIAAHNLALADGIKPDTDDYFAAIEDTLRIRKPTNDVPEQIEEGAMSAAAAPVQRRSGPPAAPVSRSGNNATGKNANKFTMTADMREMAKAMKMTDEEYAKNFLALKKEGKITSH